jgi:glycerol-3-phosphate cytidylyltransferase-like family protein
LKNENKDWNKLLVKLNRTHLNESMKKNLFALTGNQRAVPERSVKLVHEVILEG